MIESETFINLVFALVIFSHLDSNYF